MGYRKTAISILSLSFCALYALDVPLTVKEPSGVDRTGDYVTSGVPLPMGAAGDPGALCVTDAAGAGIPCQFRVLERWGKDNSIKWVLCDFQTDLSANASKTFRLKDAGSAMAGQITWSENASEITVNTGAATFRISRTSFNLFRQVKVGSAVLLDTASGTNSFMTDDSGTCNMSDKTPAVTIEEAGSMRLVVLAKGQYGSPRPGYFRYHVRLYFYSGRSYVRVQHVLVPVIGAMPAYLYDFKDLNLTLDLNPGAGRQYLAGGESSNSSYAVAPGDTLSLYQDAGGDDNWADENAWQGTPVNTFRGYRLRNGSSQVEAGNYPQGWAGLSGANGGVFAVVKDFKYLHPKALDLTGNRIIIRLWPKYYSVKHYLQWGMQSPPASTLYGAEEKTHDVFLYFHAGNLAGTAASDLGRQFNRPLIAYAGAAWYRTSNAVEQGLGIPATAIAPFTYSPAYAPSGMMSGVTRFGWQYGEYPNGGGWHTNAAPCMQGFYYTGDYNWFEYTKRLGEFYQDMAMWFDGLHIVYGEESGYQTLTDLNLWGHNTSSYTSYNLVTNYKNDMSKAPVDLGHAWLYPMYEKYYLTGELRTLDAIRMLGEKMKWYTWRAQGADFENGDRGLGGVLKNLTHAWRLTGDTTFRDYMTWNMRINRYPGLYRDSTCKPILALHKPCPRFFYACRGRNIPNLWFDPNFCETSLFVLAMFQHSMAVYYEATRDEDARDLLWSVGRGFLFYSKYRRTSTPGTGGIWSGGLKDECNTKDDESPGEVNTDGSSPGYGEGIFNNYHPQYLFPFAFGYEYTGDKRFMHRAAEMWNDYYKPTYDRAMYGDPWYGNADLHGISQKYISMRDNPRSDSLPPDSVSDLVAAPGGLGEVILNFTVPGDNSGRIAEYIAKFDTFKIVDTIVLTPPGLDTTARLAYWDNIQGTLHAFWQADNTPLEPSPLLPGARDTVYIHGLDTSKTYYFALKTYDPSSNLSEVSNVVTAMAGKSGPVHTPRIGVEKQENTGRRLCVNVYPNPFNPATLIRVQGVLPGGTVSFLVYDIAGRTVANRTLPVSGGESSLSFNGSRLASGMYWVRVKAGQHTAIKPMILIK